MLKSIVGWWKERLKTRREALMFERQVQLTWDDTGLTATFPAGNGQAIAWADINSIAIETNDSGPWGADVWWRIEGSQSLVAYPQGAMGEEQMLEELSRRFPALNHEAVALAMCCTDNARFVCWERADAAGTASIRAPFHNPNESGQ